jgi:hypothetical protein
VQVEKGHGVMYLTREPLLYTAPLAGVADLPTEVVLFTIYARSCDPTLDYLRTNEQYTDEQVIGFLLSTCFDGLR